MPGETTIRRREKVAPERWHRLKDIVCDALEQPAGPSRDKIIEQQCKDDAALRAEVLSLVADGEAVGMKLGAAIEECVEQTGIMLWRDDPIRIGWRIGAYAVVRPIGHGGMATVYLARRVDGQFEKEVAIKVLKRGTDTDEVLRRFAGERHILARLEHPNITHLLDAGTTDDGLPYFVMEYVAGIPVTDFVRERELFLEDRLALFFKICSAVIVAHGNNVIHRDLKPSNILVNAQGEPKLLDFGIAKLLPCGGDIDKATSTVEQRFTPLWASPEQARGELVTSASDIYALGAVLYEVLTETSPYSFAESHPSREEVQRAVCEQVPPLPSKVAPVGLRGRLRGTLDRIVLCAMRKEAERRYSSVEEFVRDLRGYLDGRAVSVPPLPFKDRVARIAATPSARRAGIVAAVLLAAAILVAVLAHKSSPAGAHLPLRVVAPTEEAVSAKSIAVLPFRNLTAESDDSFFADGIHDAILTDLAKVADLKVISANSVRQYASEAWRDVSDISGQLTVAHIVEGNVQRLGNRVRVSARLIDTRTGTQEWAETYQREIADVFALQSDLAQAIVVQLQAKMLPAEKAGIEHPPTRDAAAYDLFVRGRKIVDGRVDEQDQRASLVQAVSFLEEAVGRDPSFTLAMCYDARAHSLLYGNGLDPSPARLRLAEASLASAKRLQPDSAEVHLAEADIAFRCYSDFSRANAELELARARLPNDSAFYVLAGNVDRRLGRWTEALHDLAKAVEIDPKSPDAVNYLADTQILLRRFADAIGTYERAAQLGLDSPILRIRIAIIKFAASGNADELRGALAAAPDGLDIGGGETPLRIMTALLRHDTEGAARALAASPRVDFQDVDFSFYYPRAWYEAMIARAAGDRGAEVAALTAARSVLEERMYTAPRNRTRCVLAQVYAAIGLKSLAIREAQAAVEAMPFSKDAYEAPLVLQALARVYLETGDRDRAIQIAGELVKAPGYLSYGYLSVDPWLSLRDDPRFQQILSSLAPAPAG